MPGWVCNETVHLMSRRARFLGRFPKRTEPHGLTRPHTRAIFSLLPRGSRSKEKQMFLHVLLRATARPIYTKYIPHHPLTANNMKESKKKIDCLLFCTFFTDLFVNFYPIFYGSNIYVKVESLFLSFFFFWFFIIIISSSRIV